MDIPYVVISALPIDQQEPFSKWLIGQTVPTIKDALGNHVNCAHLEDYNSWKLYAEIGHDLEPDNFD